MHSKVPWDGEQGGCRIIEFKVEQVDHAKNYFALWTFFSEKSKAVLVLLQPSYSGFGIDTRKYTQSVCGRQKNERGAAVWQSKQGKAVERSLSLIKTHFQVFSRPRLLK